MSTSNQNREDALPPWLQELKNRTHESEFLTPDGYFEKMEKEVFINVTFPLSDIDEFETPVGYFDDAVEKINAALHNPEMEEDFFDEQKEQILGQIRLSGMESENTTFEVPDGFFEKQKKEILEQIGISGVAGRTIQMNFRYFGYVAAAASVIVALFFFWPVKNSKENAFAAKLEQTDLDVDDLEYFADEETYYELFLNETEMDTLSIDSIGASGQKMELNQEKTRESVKLDPRTGLPIENGIKPLETGNTLTWDDVTDEDLMKYLLEEGDDELIEDMN